MEMILLRLLQIRRTFVRGKLLKEKGNMGRVKQGILRTDKTGLTSEYMSCSVTCFPVHKIEDTTAFQECST
jgi:hypothetical protein